MPTIKPKRQKGKQAKIKHEKREKKVTKKREPTADFVQLYIITAVYAHSVYVDKEQYNVIIQNHL